MIACANGIPPFPPGTKKNGQGCKTLEAGDDIPLRDVMGEVGDIHVKDVKEASAVQVKTTDKGTKTKTSSERSSTTTYDSKGRTASESTIREVLTTTVKPTETTKVTARTGEREQTTAEQAREQERYTKGTESGTITRNSTSSENSTQSTREDITDAPGSYVKTIVSDVSTETSQESNATSSGSGTENEGSYFFRGTAKSASTGSNVEHNWIEENNGTTSSAGNYTRSQSNEKTSQVTQNGTGQRSAPDLDVGTNYDWSVSYVISRMTSSSNDVTDTGTVTRDAGVETIEGTKVTSQDQSEQASYDETLQRSWEWEFDSLSFTVKRGHYEVEVKGGYTSANMAYIVIDGDQSATGTQTDGKFNGMTIRNTWTKVTQNGDLEIAGDGTRVHTQHTDKSWSYSFSQDNTWQIGAEETTGTEKIEIRVHQEGEGSQDASNTWEDTYADREIGGNHELVIVDSELDRRTVLDYVYTKSVNIDADGKENGTVNSVKTETYKKHESKSDWTGNTMGLNLVYFNETTVTKTTLDGKIVDSVFSGTPSTSKHSNYSGQAFGGTPSQSSTPIVIAQPSRLWGIVNAVKTFINDTIENVKPYAWLAATTIADAFVGEYSETVAQAKKDAWEAVGLGGGWAETIGDMAAGVLREAVILGAVFAASAIPVVGPFIVGAYFAWQAYEGAKVVYSGVQDVLKDDPDYLGGGLKIGLGTAQVVGSLFGLGRVVKATATPLLKRLASTIGVDDALPSAPPKVNVKTVSSNADPKCFPAGTIISTSLGLRSIETIRVGDHVWAFDLMSAQWHLRTVLELYEFEYDDEIVEVTVENETISSTIGHPFWVIEGEALDERPTPEHILRAYCDGSQVPGRWVDSHDLQLGDVLLLKDRKPARITGLGRRPSAGIVYNFAVDDLHCYAVGALQVLVHNECNFVDISELEASADAWKAANIAAGTLQGEVKFGQNFASKVRKHIDQVRNRGLEKDPIPSPGKGGIEAVEKIIRDRVALGGGRATTFAGEPAVAFKDGGVTYIFRTSGEFWTILGN